MRAVRRVAADAVVDDQVAGVDVDLQAVAVCDEEPVAGLGTLSVHAEITVPCAMPPGR